MMIADGGANEQKLRSNDSGVEAKKRTKMKNIYHFALRRVVAPRSATNHGRQYTFSSENGFKCWHPSEYICVWVGFEMNPEQDSGFLQTRFRWSTLRGGFFGWRWRAVTVKLASIIWVSRLSKGEYICPIRHQRNMKNVTLSTISITCVFAFCVSCWKLEILKNANGGTSRFDLKWWSLSAGENGLLSPWKRLDLPLLHYSSYRQCHMGRHF